MSNAAARIHPFEKAGLGTAPFRFVRHYRSVFQAIPGDPSCPVQSGSSCDYCANGISEVYVVRSADDLEFKVGCDCIGRVAKEAATDADQKLAAAADSARRKANRAKAHAKSAVVKERLEELLATENVRDLLATQPHPKFCSKTLLDHADWMLTHSGAAGRAKLLKVVLAALESS